MHQMKEMWSANKDTTNAQNEEELQQRNRLRTVSRKTTEKKFEQINYLVTLFLYTLNQQRLFHRKESAYSFVLHARVGRKVNIFTLEFFF